MKRFTYLILVALFLSTSIAQAQADPWANAERKPGLVAQITAKLNEEAWFVPGGPDAEGKPTVLKARVFRPGTPGPFKVAVISHGSPAKGSDRPKMAVPSYRSASEWLVARGYMVVIPLRRGYGEPGPWIEGFGKCNDADFVSAGRATADDIEAVARYFRTIPEVRRDRVLLVGVSAGGFGVMASAQRNIDGVFALLNFSGGRGGHQGRNADMNCSPDQLVEAAGTFGAGAKKPSLWIYAENDTFFDSELSQSMTDAFKEAGGNVEYLLMPDFKNEGHSLFGDIDGRSLWAEPVAKFLKKFE
ncbi:MAG: prolyl oligopeptidase family serine peptidase [Sulfuricella sp.]|nr:prolyl oligopeptidase family serine peptidase [Sulfuricella sp.]